MNNVDREAQRERMMVRQGRNPKNAGSVPANKVFSEANNPEALYKMVKVSQTRKLGALYDREGLAEEISLFFDFCFTERLTPSVASLATWLGVHRDTLHEWETNQAKGVSDLIKNAKQTILAIQETSVLNGAIPPIPFIFLAKNYHAMSDKQDITVTPGTQQGLTPEEVNSIVDALPDPNVIDY